MCLVVVSVGILSFGVITVLPPVAGGNLLTVANGLASIDLAIPTGMEVPISGKVNLLPRLVSPDAGDAARAALHQSWLKGHHRE